MAKKKLISPSVAPKSGRIVSDYENDGEPPLWCFKHLKKGYGFGDINCKDKALKLARSFDKRANQSWNDLLRKSSDDGIVRCAVNRDLKVDCPYEFSDESEFLKFAVSRKDGRVVGFKRGRVFCVLWIDFKMDITKH